MIKPLQFVVVAPPMKLENYVCPMPTYYTAISEL